MTSKRDKKQTLIRELYQIGVIQFGEFTLKSGIISPIYIDLRRIISYPNILRAVSQAISDTLSTSEFDLICGIPYTALPIATCISLENNIPMILRRKEKKSHGTKQQIEGVYTRGQTCLLVEDVITTGGSVLETVNDLTNAGLKIIDIAVFLDRESSGKQNLMQHHYRVHTALTLSEILECLSDTGLLSHDNYMRINQFRYEHS